MYTRNRCVLYLVWLLGLCVVPAVTAQTTPSLGFAPERVSLSVAEPGIIEILVSDAQDLAGFELDLRFNPAVVAVDRVERVVGTSAQPTPGRAWVSLPMSGDAGLTYIQHAPGHIAFGGYSFGEGNPAGPSGDLTLVRLHLRGVTAGESTLTISQALITNRYAQPTAPTATGGRVTVGGAVFSLFLPYIIAAQPAPGVP